MKLRGGVQNRDIVEFLLDEDPTWKENNDKILKMLFTAAEGGNKDILQLLLTRGDLKWKDYNGDCLKMAVEKNNMHAVNFLLLKTYPLPSIDEIDAALHLAREKQAELKAASELREVGHIIDELEAVPKSNLIRGLSNSKGGSEETHDSGQQREQYMMLLDELRGKSKNTAFDEMDACLRRF
jgi:hypothetical protein